MESREQADEKEMERLLREAERADYLWTRCCSYLMRPHQHQKRQLSAMKMMAAEDPVRIRTASIRRRTRPMSASFASTLSNCERSLEQKTRRRKADGRVREQASSPCAGRVTGSSYGSRMLRRAQSVDVYQAQLEEKDKTIEALKQAAKERDWKLEKLQLNLQTFKSVGSLKDSAVFSPYYNEELASNASGTGAASGNSNNNRVCDYTTYMQLLQENAELQRANRLLTALTSSSKSSSHYELLQTELRVAEARTKDLEAMLQGQNVDLTLVEEKRHLQHLNLALSEKVSALQAREARTLSRLHDVKEQAELLEFRVLELEEERERAKSERSERTECSLDSGCNSSIATNEDPSERYQDFRKEKVTDTKQKLQAMVSSVTEADDKSLLLQTVALFETLLVKIHALQDENDALKARDSIVLLELEDARSHLDQASQVTESLRSENHVLADKVASLEKFSAHKDGMQKLHSKVEHVLKKQLADLRLQFDSSVQGRQAESEMCEEAMERSSFLERTVTELTAKVIAVEEENSQLRDQLATALGHLDSDFNSSPECQTKGRRDVEPHERQHKMTGSSSGVSSDRDLSDSEHEADMPKLDRGIFEGLRSEIGTQTASADNNSRLVSSEYAGSSCDELDDLKEECRELVCRKNSLEDEIEAYKGEISTLRQGVSVPSEKVAKLERLEFSLRNQLKEWEKKYRGLYQHNQALLEEKCELEEAENDSRLKAQRLEHQYRVSVENNTLLKEELNLERKNHVMLQDEFTELQGRESDLKNETAYLEALVQRYEQRIFDLEEVEMELRYKLTLLEQACYAVALVHAFSRHSQLGARRALPLVIEFTDKETQTGLDLQKLVGANKSRLQDALRDLETEKRRLISEGTAQGQVLVRISQLEKTVARLLDETRASHEIQVPEVIGQQEEDGERLEEEDDSCYQTSSVSVVEGESSSSVMLLQTELRQLQEKEAAYNKTIQEADAILATVGMQLVEQQKLNADMKSEMDKHEELVANLGLLRKECEDLNEELARLRVLEKRLTDIQQTEEFLRGRVDELEQTELLLRDSLAQSEKAMVEKDKAHTVRVENLQSELEAQREVAKIARDDLERQNTLKIEVESKLSEVEVALESKASELEHNETSFRSELQKLRIQLRLANSQLRDLDGVNSRLRSEMAALKVALSAKEDEAELAKQREEQAVIRYNMAMTEKEESVKAEEKRLSGEELNILAEKEGGIMNVTREVLLTAHEINDCPRCKDTHAPRLVEAASQLQTLSNVICGQFESTNLPLDLLRCESEENIKDQYFLSSITNVSDLMPLDSAEFGLPSINSEADSSVYFSSASTTAASDIQAKLQQMEIELSIAGQESRDFQSKLLVMEDQLLAKDEEIDYMRKANRKIVDELAKQKGNYNNAELQQKCSTKDFLIKTLVDVLRSCTDVRTCAIIRHLREATYKPSYVRDLDFNLESLCRFVEAGAFLHQRKRSGENHRLTDSEHSPIPPRLNAQVDPTLPSPQGLKITRVVGESSLLLAWVPPKDNDVKGYTIYVNGEPRQNVRSSTRTKALVHGLALDCEFVLSIESSNGDKKVSKRNSISYNPVLLKQLANKKPPPIPRIEDDATTKITVL